jgi:predicted GNAT family N-acyltransferase
MCIPAQPTVDIRSPSDAGLDLTAFEALVIAGGEVAQEGLGERIRWAAWLIQLQLDGHLVGVAALKQASARYRKSLAKKCGVAVPDRIYPYEFGWLVVPKKFEGRRYYRLIMNAALAQSGGGGIFATTRCSNERMHRILPAYGFAVIGNPYLSDRDDYELEVFTRPTSPPVSLAWPGAA